MEIDKSIVELVRTCLKEEWSVDEVSDDKVKPIMEMTLVVSVMHDLDRLDLPKTADALCKYLEEKGILVKDDPVDEEGDSDAEEKRENEVEFQETPHAAENS